MVYSGKPSTACHACRSRRAKCDREKPGCTQCARKFITCPGYRDLSDLCIRDETDTVVRKARKRRKHIINTSSSSTTGASTGGTSPRSPPTLDQLGLMQNLAKVSVDTNQEEEEGKDLAGSTEQKRDIPVPTIPTTLTQPLEGVATAIFLTLYVPTSKYSNLLGNYADDSLLRTGPVSSALQATALAYLSISHPIPAISRAADQNYCLALTQTNAALASPCLATLDSTLLSVLLLGLFESLVFRDRWSTSSWIVHTRGALALLRLRGRLQFAAPRGRALFALAADSIRTSCMLRAESVPHEILALEAQVAVTESGSSLKLRYLGQFMDRLVAVRVALNRPGITAEAYVDLMRQARALDEQVAAKGPKLPSCKADNQRSLASRAVDVRVAKSWLTVRMIRLFLNNGLRMKALSISFESNGWGNELVNEVLMVNEMGLGNVKTILTEILTAIPYFSDPIQGGSAMVARYLILPLTFLANSEFCPPSKRAYLVDQLRELRKRWKLSPAEEAAKMLESSVIPEDWLLCPYLER